MRNNWPTKKLGEVLISLESGSRPKGGVRQISDGIPSIGAEHLDANGGFNLEKIKFIPHKFYQNLKRGVIKCGDVLVVKDGATTGKVSLVNQHFPFNQAAVNEHVFILRPNTKLILSEFLFRFLFSETGQDQILSTFHGAAQGGINSDFVNHVKIPLPPLAEQKRIVEKIKKIFAKIDEAERLRAEAASASAALLPAVMHQIFSRAEKENWPTKKLGEVLVALETGSRPQGGVKHITSGIPSIGAEHLNDNGGFNLEKLKFIPIDFFEKLKRGIIKNGDILVVKDGATTGKISIVTDDFPFEQAAVNEHIFILKPKIQIVLNKFLFYFLFSKIGQQQILATFHGATQGGINSNFVNHVKIPLPPIEEQKKIVAYLDSLTSKIRELQDLQSQTTKDLISLKQSLLKEVFG